jgi:hypothetical protein
MYTLEEIAAMRQKCVELQLEGREILEKYTDAELQKICNGIGPEAFPDPLRECIDKLNPTLKPAAFIHDVDWHESCGRYEEFQESNSRLRRNGELCADAEYSFFNPLRYWVRFKAAKFAALCNWGGWEFYRQNFEKGKKGCVTS